MSLTLHLFSFSTDGIVPPVPILSGTAVWWCVVNPLAVRDRFVCPADVIIIVLFIAGMFVWTSSV